MHQIQEKLLKLMDREDLSVLSLRQIATKIEETGSPQKIKHHLNQLTKKGLIVIDKKNNQIKKVSSGLDKKTNLISLPIYGRANCGEATFFAQDQIEGYLKVSKNILGDFVNRIKDLFVVIAVGSSMNRADVANNTIENGDYIIVDRSQKNPSNGDYVVSIIDNVANIKKIHLDNKNEQLILISESTQDFPPIYIHRDDLDHYNIAGKVVKVMKQPDEMAIWQEMGARDILKALGPMSEEEYKYYNNPDNFKKYA